MKIFIKFKEALRICTEEYNLIEGEDVQEQLKIELDVIFAQHKNILEIRFFV